MTSTEEWRIRKDRHKCERPGCPLPTAAEWFAVLDLPDCARHDLCEACFQSLPAEGSERPIYWRARRKEDGKKAVTLDLASLRILFDRLGDVEAERAEQESEPDAESASTEKENISGAEAREEAPVGASEPGAAEDERGKSSDEDAARASIEAAAGLRFFVALLLVRKRQLRIVDPVGPEQEAADLVVVDPKASEEAEPVLLFQPDLSEERLEGLKDELLQALAAGESS